MEEAAVRTATKAFDIAENGVEYRKPEDNGKIELIAGVLGLLLLPVGGSAAFQTTITRAVEAAAAKASKGLAAHFANVVAQSTLASSEAGLMAVASLAQAANPMSDLSYVR